MYNLACRACGIVLGISPDMSVGVCPRCGNKLSIPKLDSQQKADVYTKLATMIREKKFEQSVGVARQLVQYDATDPAAYWELLMAKHGVAYAQTEEGIVPLPNFISNTLITEDPDFNTMMNCSAPDKRNVYREEALRIAQAQAQLANSIRQSANMGRLRMQGTQGSIGAQQKPADSGMQQQVEPSGGIGQHQKNVYFIDETVKKRIEGEIEMVIGEWPESEEETYTRAYGMLRGARYEADFKEAAYYFSKIKGYKNSTALYDECIKRLATSHYDTMYNTARNFQTAAMTEADLNKAIGLYEQIREWKDSGLQISLCQKKIMDMRRDEKIRAYQEEQEREERKYMAESAAKGFFKVVGVPVIIFAMIFILGWCANLIWAPGIKYKWAVEAMENKQYVTAIQLFKELEGYKDSAEKVKNILEIDKSLDVLFANVGDTVTFGEHIVASPKGNQVGEIEWYVADKVDGKLLLISKYGIDSIPYNRTKDSLNYWDKSYIREWLNTTFFVFSFSPVERTLVMTGNVKTDFSVSQKNIQPIESSDKVFLLSAAEASKYLADPEKKKMKGSEKFFAAYPEHYNESGNCMWWLRDAGSKDGTASFINQLGFVVPAGTMMSDNRPLVRPAMWISAEMTEGK